MQLVASPLARCPREWPRQYQEADSAVAIRREPDPIMIYADDNATGVAASDVGGHFIRHHTEQVALSKKSVNEIQDILSHHDIRKDNEEAARRLTPLRIGDLDLVPRAAAVSVHPQ